MSVQTQNHSRARPPPEEPDATDGLTTDEAEISAEQFDEEDPEMAEDDDDEEIGYFDLKAQAGGEQQVGFDGEE